MKLKHSLLVALTWCVLSCNSTRKEAYTILKGKLLNSDLSEIKLNSDDQYFDHRIQVNADGTFCDTLDLKDGRYTLFDGKNNVITYIGKGNELSVEYDVLALEQSLKVEGEGAKMTDYFIAKNKILQAEYAKTNEIFALDEAAFKKTIDSIRSVLTALLPESPYIAKSFIDKEKRSLKYAYLDKLNQYEQRHQYSTKNSDFKVSNTFLNPLDEMTFDRAEDYQYTIDYKNLLAREIGKKALVVRERDSLTYEESFFRVVKDISNEQIRNMFLFDNMRYLILTTEDLDNTYSSFKAISSDPNHLKDVTKTYDALKSVSKGNPSPKFTKYKNHSGEATSLDDLQGSYVYIDIWATWCAPCKAEIPFLQKIEKKFHGKNIKFVSISVDVAKDYETWKKMVTDMNLTGIQLFADNNFESEFIKGYAIRSIPRFILIDPQGIIVDGNAPRPSNPKLVELFNELEI